MNPILTRHAALKKKIKPSYVSLFLTNQKVTQPEIDTTISLLEHQGGYDALVELALHGPIPYDDGVISRLFKIPLTNLTTTTVVKSSSSKKLVLAEGISELGLKLLAAHYGFQASRGNQYLKDTLDYIFCLDAIKQDEEAGDGCVRCGGPSDVCKFCGKLQKVAHA
jgi:hypothetical protein